MSQATQDTDALSWHERFAMSCNNRAWELSVQPRTPAQDREMLDAAHASAWHWAQIGTELNRMRATMLLAEVHTLLGLGPSALRLAEEMRVYFVNRDTPDWELAFTHAIYAHAAYINGRLAEHRLAHAEASAALSALTDEEDRSIVSKTFVLVPRPAGPMRSPDLSTVEIKAFVPARDFELSKQFYAAVGFTIPWSDDELAYLHAGNSSFLLQSFFVEDHAKNFQMHLLVENVDDWHRYITEKDIAGRFGVRVGQPEDQPWAMRDFTLFDPSGVLWRIAQNIPKTTNS